MISFAELIGIFTDSLAHFGSLPVRQTMFPSEPNQTNCLLSKVREEFRLPRGNESLKLNYQNEVDSARPGHRACPACLETLRGFSGAGPAVHLPLEGTCGFHYLCKYEKVQTDFSDCRLPLGEGSTSKQLFLQTFKTSHSSCLLPPPPPSSTNTKHTPFSRLLWPNSTPSPSKAHITAMIYGS